MGDDVGWFNIGAYHRGIMSGKTPNLDKLAAEGMMFTDYYAEASRCARACSCLSCQAPFRICDRGRGRSASSCATSRRPDQSMKERAARKGRPAAQGW
jgi:hypothetical protein